MFNLNPWTPLIPATMTDSFSYLEQLCIIKNKLNEVITNLNNANFYARGLKPGKEIELAGVLGGSDVFDGERRTVINAIIKNSVLTDNTPGWHKIFTSKTIDSTLKNGLTFLFQEQPLNENCQEDRLSWGILKLNVVYNPTEADVDLDTYKVKVVDFGFEEERNIFKNRENDFKLVRRINCDGSNVFELYYNVRKVVDATECDPAMGPAGLFTLMQLDNNGIDFDSFITLENNGLNTVTYDVASLGGSQITPNVLFDYDNIELTGDAVGSGLMNDREVKVDEIEVDKLIDSIELTGDVEGEVEVGSNHHPYTQDPATTNDVSIGATVKQLIDNIRLTGGVTGSATVGQGHSATTDNDVEIPVELSEDAVKSIIDDEYIQNIVEQMDLSYELIPNQDTIDYYVDTVNGDDETGDGTQALPFKTVNAMLNQNKARTINLHITGNGEDNYIIDCANHYTINFTEITNSPLFILRNGVYNTSGQSIKIRSGQNSIISTDKLKSSSFSNSLVKLNNPSGSFTTINNSIVIMTNSTNQNYDINGSTCSNSIFISNSDKIAINCSAFNQCYFNNIFIKTITYIQFYQCIGKVKINAGASSVNIKGSDLTVNSIVSTDTFKLTNSNITIIGKSKTDFYTFLNRVTLDADSSINFPLKLGSDLMVADSSNLGLVKVDGTTVTADSDGTIHAVGGGSGEPAAYLKSASVSGDTLTLTNKDDSTVTFTPSGEPANYIKDASVSGNTLTLTKKDDSTVTYTPTIPSGGDFDLIPKNDSLSIINVNYESGDDSTGDGSQNNPYKTVETAINKTRNDRKIKINLVRDSTTLTIPTVYIDGTGFTEITFTGYTKITITDLHIANCEKMIIYLDYLKFVKGYFENSYIYTPSGTVQSGLQTVTDLKMINSYFENKGFPYSSGTSTAIWTGNIEMENSTFIDGSTTGLTYTPATFTLLNSILTFQSLRNFTAPNTTKISKSQIIIRGNSPATDGRLFTINSTDSSVDVNIIDSSIIAYSDYITIVLNRCNLFNCYIGSESNISSTTINNNGARVNIYHSKFMGCNLQFRILTGNFSYNHFIDCRLAGNFEHSSITEENISSITLYGSTLHYFSSHSSSTIQKFWENLKVYHSNIITATTYYTIPTISNSVINGQYTA